jgi:hypothetical protein
MAPGIPQARRRSKKKEPGFLAVGATICDDLDPSPPDAPGFSWQKPEYPARA